MGVASSLPVATRVAVHLRDEGAATVTEIARTLELSRTSVETAISSLVRQGVVFEAPSIPAKGVGRPARRYVFESTGGVVVGLDVGAGSLRIVTATLSGRVVSQSSLPGVAEAKGAVEKLAVVTAGVRQALATARQSLADVRAVGVALPGIVDGQGHLVTSVVIPEWSGVDIGGQLREFFDCPVMIDNGVRLAAVAEHHMGAAQLMQDVLYLSVGHRIALGLILGGTPRRGAHNIAGDIGRSAFRGFDMTTGQIEWRSASTAEEVFAQAREGSSDAQREIQEFIDRLARGIATLVMTVDPEMVVIGGGLSRAHEDFFAPLREAVPRHIGLPISVPIVEAQLGAEAAVHGALIHAFSAATDHVYGLERMTTPRIQMGTR